MVKGTLWLDSEETVFCFEYKALGRRKRQKIFLKGKLSLQMKYLQLYITIGPVMHFYAVTADYVWKWRGGGGGWEREWTKSILVKPF